MYQYRNRYYHAQLGRFVTRDPIGYEGSEWNLYEYVGGMPVQYFDPFGRTCQDEYRTCVGACGDRGDGLAGCVRLCRFRRDNCLRREDPTSDVARLLTKAEEFGALSEVEEAVRQAESFSIPANRIREWCGLNDANDLGLGGNCGESTERIFEEIDEIGRQESPEEPMRGGGVVVRHCGVGVGKNRPWNPVHNWVEIGFIDYDPPHHRTNFVIDNGAIGGDDFVGDWRDKHDFFLIDFRRP